MIVYFRSKIVLYLAWFWFGSPIFMQLARTEKGDAFHGNCMPAL